MVSKKIYFFIDKINEINLDQVKKTGAILILRKSKDISHKSLRKFASNCKSKRIDLFVANCLKLLFLLKTNRFYISAWNKKYYKHLKSFNNNMKIIGSAHNAGEIHEKIKQGCSQIVLSRIFKTKYKNKKTFLGKVKFNLLTRYFKLGFIALGGINSYNFNQTKNLNIVACAMSSDKKKPVNIYRLFSKKLISL